MPGASTIKTKVFASSARGGGARGKKRDSLNRGSKAKNIARRLPREIKLLSLEDYTPQSLGSKREFFEDGSVGILFRLLRDRFKPECRFILVF